MKELNTQQIMEFIGT